MTGRVYAELVPWSVLRCTVVFAGRVLTSSNYPGDTFLHVVFPGLSPEATVHVLPAAGFPAASNGELAHEESSDEQEADEGEEADGVLANDESKDGAEGEE